MHRRCILTHCFLFRSARSASLRSAPRLVKPHPSGADTCTQRVHVFNGCTFGASSWLGFFSFSWRTLRFAPRLVNRTFGADTCTQRVHVYTRMRGALSASTILTRSHVCAGVSVRLCFFVTSLCFGRYASGAWISFFSQRALRFAPRLILTLRAWPSACSNKKCFSRKS